MTNKVEQMILAMVSFFWCFLMWFSTAAFSPSIGAEFGLTKAQLGILASSAIWLAPPGRVIAGYLADRIGAPNTFTIILAYAGIASIASSFATTYDVLFVERVIVASAGISFVVGIQHVAQWFEEEEIGTAEGLYAGTGNAGAGTGALLLPRLYYTTDAGVVGPLGAGYSDAFMHLGIVALILAIIYYWRGVPAVSVERAKRAKKSATLRDTLFVWTRWTAIALMLAYAMSFGVEIAMNAWLPGYFSTGFASELQDLGYTEVASIQMIAGTFAAVQSFNGGLMRPLSGYMSDLWQRNNWTPLPVIAKNQKYSPRAHWLGISLIMIVLAAVAFTIVGLAGIVSLAVIIVAFVGLSNAFAEGAVFSIVPVLFKDRPGTATGFIGGVSTAGGIIYPLVYGYSPNIHMGYVYAAAGLFVPFILFYIWSMRYETHPEEHGIGSKEYWVGR